MRALGEREKGATTTASYSVVVSSSTWRSFLVDRVDLFPLPKNHVPRVLLEEEEEEEEEGGEDLRAPGEEEEEEEDEDDVVEEEEGEKMRVGNQRMAIYVVVVVIMNMNNIMTITRPLHRV